MSIHCDLHYWFGVYTLFYLTINFRDRLFYTLTDRRDKKQTAGAMVFLKKGTKTGGFLEKISKLLLTPCKWAKRWIYIRSNEYCSKYCVFPYCGWKTVWSTVSIKRISPRPNLKRLILAGRHMLQTRWSEEELKHTTAALRHCDFAGNYSAK